MEVELTAGKLIDSIKKATALDGVDDTQLMFEDGLLVTGGVSIDNSRFSHIEVEGVEVIEPGVWNIVLVEEVLKKLKNFNASDSLTITSEGGKIKVHRKSPSKYYTFSDATEKDVLCKRAFVPEMQEDLTLVLHRIKDGAELRAAKLTVEIKPNLKDLKAVFKGTDVFKDSIEIIFDDGILEIYTEVNALGSGDLVECEELYTFPEERVHSYYKGLGSVVNSLGGEVVIYFANENLIYVEDIQEDVTAYYLVMQKSDLS